MKARTQQRETPVDYLLIPHAFFPLGWVLLEIWLVAINAPIATHVVVSLFVMYTMAVPFLHYRRWYKSSCLQPSGLKKVPLRKDVGIALLIFALGGVLGLLVIQASTLLLFAVAAAMIYIPWLRVPVRQGNLALACVILWAGVGAALAIGHGSISLSFLPLATWALWSCATVALILHFAQALRVKSQPKASTTAASLEHT